MPARLLIILFAIAALFSTSLSANFEIKRKQFLAAEKAYKLAGNGPLYRTLKAGLRDYPLLPYLQFAELKNSLGSASAQQIRDFVKQYEGSPLSGHLLNRWLTHLHKTRQAKTFLAFYPGGGSAKRQCQAGRAMYRSGDKAGAWKMARKLWLHGKSRPKECDPLFDEWRKTSNFNGDLVWRRLALAMGKRQLSLAKYLSGMLNKSDKVWADLWQLADKNPAKALASPSLKRAHAYRPEIVVHALSRQARKDPRRALKDWKRWQKTIVVDDGNRQHFAYNVLRELRDNDAPADAVALAGLVDVSHTDDRAQEMRLRIALKAQAWPELLGWLKQSGLGVRQRSAWRYWQAHALHETGQLQPAKRIFADLAKERSYYGFLAADELGTDYQFGHQQLKVTKDRRQDLEMSPAAQRIVELLALGRQLDARREWRDWTGSLDRAGQVGAAIIASSWDWHRQVVLTLAKAEAWNDLKLRFPLAQRQTVEKHASTTGLEKDWVFGLIRQESAFSPTVRSPAGAVGLMQLMPATARYVARKLKLKKPRRKDLHKPELNIRLGTTYLKEQLERFGGHRALATAAYNAGPHRVDKWLPKNDSLPAPIWVELIPFRETRTYVQRVFAYAAIYRTHLGDGDDTRLSNWLLPVPPSS